MQLISCLVGIVVCRYKVKSPGDYIYATDEVLLEVVDAQGRPKHEYLNSCNVGLDAVADLRKEDRSFIFTSSQGKAREVRRPRANGAWAAATAMVGSEHSCACRVWCGGGAGGGAEILTASDA